MKKIISIILAIVMVFALAACAGNAPEDKSDPTPAPAPSPEPSPEPEPAGDEDTLLSEDDPFLESDLPVSYLAEEEDQNPESGDS